MMVSIKLYFHLFLQYKLQIFIQVTLKKTCFHVFKHPLIFNSESRSMAGSCLHIILGKGYLIFIKYIDHLLKGYLPLIFLQNNLEMLLKQ